MERKKALASASVATLVLGSAIVTAASLGHIPLLGFGTRAVAQAAAPVAQTTTPATAKPRVVVRTKDVFDRFVVDTGNNGEGTGSPTPTTNGSAPAPELSPTTVAPVATPAPEPRHESDDEPGSSEPTPPTTAPASPTTTPAGPTTLPIAPTTQRLQIPDDWPAGKPIPPVPPNCFQPELRLNGVWNCQNDD